MSDDLDDIIASAPALNDEELLAQINVFDPYDVEFARRFRAQAAELTSLRAQIEAADKLAEAMTFYANPSVYAPHPHGIAFERRDLSFHAVAALAAYEGEKG